MEAVPYLMAGKGMSPADGGCILQVIDWISTGGWTDEPACVHPRLRDIAIHINDCETDEGRQKLLDVIPRLIGTSGDSAPTTYLTLTFQELNDLGSRLHRRWESVDIVGTKKLREYIDDLWKTFYEMLDVVDEYLGRTKHDPVDLTGVCAVMAATS